MVIVTSAHLPKGTRAKDRAINGGVDEFSMAAL